MGLSADSLETAECSGTAGRPVPSLGDILGSDWSHRRLLAVEHPKNVRHARTVCRLLLHAQQPYLHAPAYLRH